MAHSHVVLFTSVFIYSLNIVVEAAILIVLPQQQSMGILMVMVPFSVCADGQRQGQCSVLPYFVKKGWKLL